MVFSCDNAVKLDAMSSLVVVQKDARNSLFSDMLPKKIRLTTSLFDQVFKVGKVQHGKLFWMRSFLLPLGFSSRFAVVIPKKVASTAVLRNKIKRLVYQEIEALLAEVPVVKTGNMTILGVKSDISIPHVAEVSKEIKELLLSRSRGSTAVEKSSKIS